MSHSRAELADYDYDLPRELIAQHPLPNRADARLMVVDRAGQSWQHRHVRDLPEIFGRVGIAHQDRADLVGDAHPTRESHHASAKVLQAGDCLVLNDSRVVPARLVGVRTETGGRWEGLFLSAGPHGSWRLLCKTRGKLAVGEAITLLDTQGREDVRLALMEKLPGGVWIAQPLAEGEPLALLDRVGRVPLPPYIRGGEMLPPDRERYQTVYATRPGSIAAPTAGLHFTEEVLAALADRGVTIARLTLHVGLGTFRPIQSETIAAHAMHAEWGELGPEAVECIARCRASSGRVIAVGTTSVRVLETAAAAGGLKPWRGETDLFIRPGHRFAAVDGLLTNFHLPRTTLLVLVRAFGGDALMRKAYEEAIRQHYRFYSYGDAMLIL